VNARRGEKERASLLPTRLLITPGLGLPRSGVGLGVEKPPGGGKVVGGHEYASQGGKGLAVT